MSGTRGRHWRLALVAVVTSFAYGGFMWGMKILSGDARGTLDELPSFAGLGGAFGVVMVVGTSLTRRHRRRRMERSPQFALESLVQRAVEEQQLPPDVDPESWLRELRHRLESEHRSTVRALYFGVPFGLFIIGIAVWLTLAPQAGASPAFGVVVLVVVVVAVVLVTRNTVRQQHTRRRFIAELEQRGPVPAR